MINGTKKAVIFDCYTVEPAGLGVPPYLSTYVRYSYLALQDSKAFNEIAYITIDDFRALTHVKSTQEKELGFTDPSTYSLTVNTSRVYMLDIINVPFDRGD